MVYWVLKVVLTPVFHLVFRVKVEGREHVPRRGPAVLAANHQSFCDSIFIPLVVARRVTFLAKAEYFDSARTAWFFRAVGQIPLRRTGGSVSERSLETARKDVLDRGLILCVYPEGTRTLDRFVHKGRTGVSRLSQECGVPVIPVGVVGTGDVQPVDAKLMRPFKTVTIRFGTPMQMEPVDDAQGAHDPANGPDNSVGSPDRTYARCRVFTDRLMREIARLSERDYVDEYVPAHRPGDSIRKRSETGSSHIWPNV